MLGHRPLTREDYLNILKRRSWIVAIPALIFPIIAFAASFLISPQYISQTLVLIEQQKVPEKYVMPVVTEDLNGRLASMKEQILSRSRLQPIIEKYNLYGTGHMSMDDRIDAARKNIDIKPIQSEIARTGGLPGFFISFKANDAKTAQLVCGDITSLFVNQNLTDRQNSAQGTTAFLQQQLADAKRTLDEQDAKLAKFQQSNAGRLPEQDNSNMNMLQSLNTQLDAATQQINRMEQDRSYEEAMLAQQSRDLPPVGATTTAVAPQTQQLELQNLLSQEADLSNRYTADYPDVVAVKRKISDLRKQMAQVPAATPSSSSASTAPRNEPLALQQLRASIRAMDQGITQKRKEQAGISGQIRDYQARLSSSPVVQQEYATLTRDHQTSQQFYDDLLKQSNQAKMAVDLERRQQGEQFRIMDEPNLPDEPAFPKRSVFAAGGLLLGLVFGIGIIALLEYRDTAIRSERDVWAFTKLPTLAVLSLSLAEGASPAPVEKTPKNRFWKRNKQNPVGSKPISAGV